MREHLSRSRCQFTSPSGYSVTARLLSVGRAAQTVDEYKSLLLALRACVQHQLAGEWAQCTKHCESRIDELTVAEQCKVFHSSASDLVACEIIEDALLAAFKAAWAAKPEVMPKENHAVTKLCAEKVLTAMETALTKLDEPCPFSFALAADIGKLCAKAQRSQCICICHFITSHFSYKSKGLVPENANGDVAQKIETCAAWLEFKSVMAHGFETKEDFLFFACLTDSANKFGLKPSNATASVKAWSPPSADVYKTRARKIFEAKVTELQTNLDNVVVECKAVSEVAAWHAGQTESLAKLRKASVAWCKEAKAVNDCLRKLSQVKKQVKDMQEAMKLEPADGVDATNANTMGASLSRAIGELTILSILDDESLSVPTRKDKIRIIQRKLQSQSTEFGVESLKDLCNPLIMAAAHDTLMK
eukprot:3246127-Amphidinium_carterae.3